METASLNWSIVIPAYLVSAGIVFFTGIHAVVMAMLGYRVALYSAFATICFCAAGFQLTMFGFYTADTLAKAAFAMRWQIVFVLIFFPVFFAFVALYTQQEKFKYWFIAITLVCAGLLITNFSSPFSLRFETLAQAAPLHLPWGESLARFAGKAGLMNGLVRLIFVSISCWTLWRAMLQYRHGEHRMALFLAGCIVLMLASNQWGALIDLGVVDSFYVVGFAFLGLVLFMSVSLGLELRDHTLVLKTNAANLQKEIEWRAKTEMAIRHIAAGVSSVTGDPFFQQLVAELAKLFGADYAFIGIIDEPERKSVSTLAVFAHGSPACNISYALEHTPCAEVMGGRTCVHAQAVSQKFPEDQLLRDMRVESYIGAPLLDSAGHPLGIIVVLDGKPLTETTMVADILEIFAARAAAEIQRLRAEGNIRRMAYQDYLTGLANRAQFHDHLSSTIEQAQCNGVFGAMLLVDLDHFKTINDALSHDVGDQVLREIARRLTAITADHAFVARLGGDEFVVMMRDLVETPQAAAIAARRLAEAVANELSGPISIGERILNVGASIGIAPFPQTCSTQLDTLRQADMALYQAKHLGRGTIQFYAPPMQAAADQRLQLEDGLRAALEKNEFTLHFQPQLNAAGRMIGAEALLRWQHPAMDDVGPSVFIPVAEETGLIHAIGAWVLDQACERLAYWQQADKPFFGRLSINVSPWQFTRADFVQQVSQILAKRHTNPNHFTIEITETALLYDLNETIEKLHALRAMGLMISLDDFGTGYSSLAYLKDLPLDELKIDKAFVHELTQSSNHALVESMVSVGRHMNLHVIAEGVETREQRDALVTMGCERFQGFLFSHPLAEENFLLWQAKNRVPDSM